jgi:hypothetical protein
VFFAMGPVMPILKRLLLVSLAGTFVSVAAAMEPSSRQTNHPRTHVRPHTPGFDLGRFFSVPNSNRLTRPTGNVGMGSAIPTRTEALEATPSPSPAPAVQPLPQVPPLPLSEVANPMANLLPPVPPPPAQAVTSAPAHLPRWGLGTWLTVSLASGFGLLVLVGLTMLAWPTRRAASPRYRRARASDFSSQPSKSA